MKKEVLKLRNQVSWLNKKVKKYKWKAVKPKVEVSSATTQNRPIEHLFEAEEFFLAVEIQKWKSVANEHKKETKRVQEKATGIITGYIDQLDIARWRPEKQHDKMKDLEE